MIGRIAFVFFALLLFVVVVFGATAPDAPQPKTYASYADLYRNVDNDRYLSLYRKADLSEQGNMLAAADRECDGRLERNFSCTAGKRGNVRQHGWRELIGKDTETQASSKVERKVKPKPKDKPHYKPQPGKPYYTLTVYYDGAYPDALSEAIQRYGYADTGFTSSAIDIRQTSEDYAEVRIYDSPGLIDPRTGKHACGLYHPTGRYIEVNPACDLPNVMSHEVAHAVGLHPHSPDVNDEPALGPNS